MASPCDLIAPIADLELQIMTEINKKLAALRRLADLLEQLGDLAVAYINQLQAIVDHLVPVVDIDVNLYLQIQSACPFLNLPALTAENNFSTAPLQAMLSAAYAGIVSKLLKHPYARMRTLESEMDSFIQNLTDNANATAILSSGFLQCLNSACNGSLITPVTGAQANVQANAYKANFSAGTGGTPKVLNPQAAAKGAQITTLLTKMQNLGAVVPVPYAQAKINAATAAAKV